MSIAEISELVGLVITGVGLIVSIVKLIKELKDKKLKALIEKYMAEAEKVDEWNGVAKKTYVIKCVLNDLGKWTEEKSQEISKYIEECIEFSKKINFKGKE